MAALTNQQSLFEDFAARICAAQGVSAPEFRWTGSRMLTITVDPSDRAGADAAVGPIQHGAADAGFKILLRVTGPQS